jgi:glycosyltransferase involved in cell wall biosynthesis
MIPRLPRPVTQRGNRREAIFLQDGDEKIDLSDNQLELFCIGINSPYFLSPTCDASRLVREEHSPVISAVIPVCDRFEFLHETIASVYSQTRVPDEVLIVDDSSIIRVESYFAQNPPPGPVKVLRTDRRRNPGGARNLGWQQAKGDLIVFHDSDDLWEPDKTRLQAEYLDLHPELDGVYGAALAFFPDGRTQPWAHDRPPKVEVASALLDANMTSPTLMIRRRALQALGGYDETLPILEDQVFSIELARAGLSIQFLPSPVVARIRRNDHNTTNRSMRYFLCACKVALRYRAISAQIFGPGSVRVHLGRNLRRFGAKSRGMGMPTRVMARLLRYSAPLSTMPLQ